MNIRPGRYRMRDGRIVRVTGHLADGAREDFERWQGRLDDGQPLNRSPLPKGVDLVSAPALTFYCWDNAGQDCAGDDRQHDLVRRLPPKFGR